MRRKIPSIEALIAFEAAARHLSFTRSADELALTQSAVGRQVAMLEAYLGVALFNRVKKRLSLTEVGQLYAKQVREHLERMERDTLAAMAHRDAGGILELAVIPTFATRWLIPRLPQFRLLYLPQSLGVTEPNAPDQQEALAPVHRITSSVYSALEGKIASDADFLAQVAPRRVAVAVHMAGVGMITMFAAADALGDPMVHAPDDMVNAMIAVLTAQTAEAPRRRTRA